MRFIVKNARQGVDKDRLGFVKTDAMILTVQTSLVVIPFKVEAHELNFDDRTSRIRVDTEPSSRLHTDFHRAPGAST
jgi:hypothetical protein